ncbi:MULTISPECIES: hypothetical protein [Haloferax]|uniref:Lipoprotein n=2 Tax=Haloferax TaxID=2251 RepID=A0A6G1Z1W2_9EURY|nr:MULTISPECIES: hypothetical protein [Haloferax]KAB1187864.1 hypothetical protein Hfx1149_07385 [Haloferax sp. CBA1149]MRW80526.1 hypothetical protein [Haloferax marinisediminis]
MKRRRVLASLGSLVALSGCTSGLSEPASDECGEFQLCEGSQMVRVFVSPEFSGEAMLDAECRDKDFELQAGDSKTIRREVDAETCPVALYVDGQRRYRDTIQDYESTTVRVNSSGEVEVETVEV